ncbi:MAG: aryl-sulfate sulfotransferase [Candidatus Izimaplasma sp.]|nr:aryl-sulfate sulfotransferase [Candidatus Izimaplasma bacterium]
MIKDKLKILLEEKNLIITIPLFIMIIMVVLFLSYGISTPTRGTLKTTKTTIQTQIELETTFLNNYDNKAYTKEDPFVILDPYNNSPLTALMMFKTETNQNFKVEILGKSDLSTITYHSKYKKNHNIPIIGLYPNYENTINIYTYDPITKETGELVTTQTIQTDPLPEAIVKPTSVSTAYSYFNTDWMVYTSVEDGYSVAYDYSGDIRWVLDQKAPFLFKQLDNGHFLIGQDSILAPPYYSDGLYEIDLLGRIYKQYNLPNGFHHDIAFLPSDNFLLLTNSPKGVEDRIVEVNHETGNIEQTWDLANYVPKTGGENIFYTETDWIHVNSIDYNHETRSIIVSAKHRDIIFSIDTVTNNVNWTIGSTDTWDQTTIETLNFLTPRQLNTTLPYAQTSIQMIDDKTMFVFNTGINRSKTESTYLPPKVNSSEGLVYSINPSNNTVSTQKVFKNEFSPGFGNATYLGENNYLVHFGGIAYTKEGSINYASTLYAGNKELTTQSKTVEYLNDTLVYEMILPKNFYSATHISPSEHAQDISFQTPQKLGEKHQTPKSKITLNYSEPLFNKVHPKYKLQLDKTSDKLIITADFREASQVTVLFIDQDGNRRFFDLNTTQPVTNATLNLFTKNQPRDTRTYYICERSASGRYDIYLIINHKRYDTYKQVIFK